MRGWKTLLSIVVLLTLTACSSGVDIAGMAEDNPGQTISVTKLEGQRAELFIAGLEGFCPGLDGEEVYRVQVISENKTVTKVFSPGGKMLCELDTNDPEYAQKSIAILVNEQPVYLSDVLNAVNTVPAQVRSEAVGNVVNTIVDNMLLLQEAEKQDIVVSDDEVNQAIQNSNLAAAQLSQQDIESLVPAVRNQLKAQKLVNQVIEDADVEVTDEEVREYYQQNQDQLVLPETYTVRHIQFNLQDKSTENVVQKAETVYGLLDTTDFCDLVSQFSDDTSSVENCGQYTFQAGQMDSMIEQQVRQMSLGDVRIVQGNRSVHVLELQSKNEPRQATFAETQEGIRNFLDLQKKQQAVQEFIQGLRSEATIVSYIG